MWRCRYVAGRTPVSGAQTSPADVPIPGSIYEAAEEVTRAGGRGIAVATDMADDAQIKALFEQVRKDSGHLNILVNNAAYLNEKMFVRSFGVAAVSLWPGYVATERLLTMAETDTAHSN